MNPSADAAGTRSFFASSLLWNVALGASFIAVPLHARAVGLPDAQIGVLLALPVILQLGLSLVAGALTDQLGGKLIAGVACLLTAAGGMAFWLAHSFISLLLAQLVLVLGRATFWPATWSLASKLPGDKLGHLGRLNACTNAGQILGTSVCGLVLAWLSFAGAFIAMSAAALLALWLNQRVSSNETASGKGFGATMASYPVLLRDPRMVRSMACGYVSALPIALSFSFFPILLTEQGYAVAAAGILIALRPIGAISGGLLARRLRHMLRHRLTPCLSALLVGLAIATSAAGLPVEYVVPAFLVLGMASSLLSVFVQVEVTDATPLEMRGAAMALVNVGWALCLLSVPMGMGWLSQWLGMQGAFYAVAALAVAAGLVFGWRSRAVLDTTAA
jgi:MFS family permease